MIIFRTPPATGAVREVGAVAARAAWIREKYEHSRGCEILEFVEPVLTVGGVRTTVDVEYERILLAGLITVRLHQPSLDLEATDGWIREALRVRPRDLRVDLVVEGSESFLIAAVGIGDEQLRRMRGVSGDKRHGLAGGVEARAIDSPATAEDLRHLLRRGIDAEDAAAPTN